MGAVFKFGVNSNATLNYTVWDVECADDGTDPTTITGTPLTATRHPP